MDLLWVPLTPVHKAGGALSVAVGIHLSPIGPSINLRSGLTDTGGLSTFNPSTFCTVCLELNAGDRVIFYPNLQHMSHPNITEDIRVAWSLVWAQPITQWDTTSVPTHPLSKEGVDRACLGHFDWK